MSGVWNWAWLSVVLAVSVVQADDAVPLPAMTVDLNASAFPSAAIKSRTQGRVLVAFNIDKRGGVNKQDVVQSEPEGTFDSAALSVVKSIKFNVPKDWDSKGGPSHRYQLSVLFKLSPCPPDTCTAPKAHPEANDFVIVGAQAK